VRGKPFSNKQPSAPQRILCKLTAKTDPLSTHVCIIMYFFIFIFTPSLFDTDEYYRYFHAMFHFLVRPSLMMYNGENYLTLREQNTMMMIIIIIILQKFSIFIYIIQGGSLSKPFFFFNNTVVRSLIFWNLQTYFKTVNFKIGERFRTI